MKFTKEEINALQGLLPTVKPLLERSNNGWFINTRSLPYKAMEQVYTDKYNRKINNTCAACVESAVREIYNEYFRYMKSLENEPKEVKKNVHKKETATNIEELRAKYKAKYDKNVSNKYKNNVEWIKSKLS